MYMAQLAAFLTAHHHALVAQHLATMSLRRFAHWVAWATARGFVYQR